jgi:hypothetical protein
MAMGDVTMDQEQRAALEAQGWRFGTAAEFLGLSPAEASYVEAYVRLSKALREWRRNKGWTQLQLAGILGSSQSRVAKAEAGDPSVSLDFLIRALFALEASLVEVGAALGGLVPQRRSAKKATRRAKR